jgi:molybdate transport system ATP-binding protein
MLFAFEKAALRSGQRIVLSDVDWRVREGEHWSVLGPNGSGKSTLLRAVLGDVAVVRGGFRAFPALSGAASGEPWNPPIGWVSYELHRRLIAREESLEAARWFSADLDGAGTAGELLRELGPAAGGRAGGGPDPAQESWVRKLVGLFELEPLLPRPFRTLSTGEFRRLLVARALVRRPRLLALDEPFDGLDDATRSGRRLGRLAGSGCSSCWSRTAWRSCSPDHPRPGPARRGSSGGDRAAARSRRATCAACTGPRGRSLAAGRRRPASAAAASGPPEVLVQMRDVRVRYGDKTVLDGLSWTMRRGERWCIRGPNGSGKSTLLALICGDHPQAYANDIRLFGEARGSGESIWDIKRRIGLLSTEFQIAYRRQASGLEVVVSGFHDSIGMYERSSPAEESSARELLEGLGLESLAERDFDSLSGGQKRLLLLARAMVKAPELLVLDEPCQGLDPANRARILATIDRIGDGTELIYVSHHRDELPRCLTHLLELPAGKSSRLEAGGQGAG